MAATLARKATKLPADVEQLRYAVCARAGTTHTDPDILVITAADIFRADV